MFVPTCQRDGPKAALKGKSRGEISRGTGRESQGLAEAQCTYRLDYSITSDKHMTRERPCLTYQERHGATSGQASPSPSPVSPVTSLPPGPASAPVCPGPGLITHRTPWSKWHHFFAPRGPDQSTIHLCLPSNGWLLAADCIRGPNDTAPAVAISGPGKNRDALVLYDYIDFVFWDRESPLEFNCSLVIMSVLGIIFWSLLIS